MEVKAREAAGGALDIVPATAGRWEALADLFGRAGASSGCWCMYWRLGPPYNRRPHEHNRDAFKELVEGGPPPGLLAFAGEVAVGWCQVTPRDDLPWVRQTRVLGPVDLTLDPAVWAVSCFFVRRAARRQQVASALLAAAVEWAGAAGASVLEGYPVDTDVPGSSRNVFTGTRAMFARAGFYPVAARHPARPTMRRDLKGAR